jgi:hypothetical protein
LLWSCVVQRTTNWKGRLSAIYLIIKVACLVKKVNSIFNKKSSWSKQVSTRRSTVLSLPFQKGFPGYAAKCFWNFHLNSGSLGRRSCQIDQLVNLKFSPNCWAILDACLGLLAKLELGLFSLWSSLWSSELFSFWLLLGALWVSFRLSVLPCFEHCRHFCVFNLSFGLFVSFRPSLGR